MPNRKITGRFSERSLWLNPALVVAAALAVFAIAFGTLTLRLAAGHDPAIGLARAGRAQGSNPALRTRSSGAGATAPAGRSGSHKPATIVTAASGRRRGANVDA
jgi:hypothetical protein